MTVSDCNSFFIFTNQQAARSAAHFSSQAEIICLCRVQLVGALMSVMYLLCFLQQDDGGGNGGGRGAGGSSRSVLRAGAHLLYLSGPVQ